MENSTFGFEIDFLPVGEKSKSGDAICMRWGNLANPKDQNVVIVDGGYAESAEAIRDHIVTYYKTRNVNLAIASHLHADHINGLAKLLELNTKGNGLSIKYVWMHDPRNHVDTDEFEDDGVTRKRVVTSLEKKAKKVCDMVDEIKKANVPFSEPFSNNTYCPLGGLDFGYGVRGYVLGPSEKYYKELLPSFSSTPTDGERNGAERLTYNGDNVSAAQGRLTDEGETSAENDASIILCLVLPNGEMIFLSGDAGMPALSEAIKQAQRRNLALSDNIRVFKIPHHGSIQNLGPEVLDGILGTPQSAKSRKEAFAMIMVSKHPEQGHPDKAVTNEIWSRNCKPYKTGGLVLHYGIGANTTRNGWRPVDPIPYAKEVDKVQ